MRSSARNIFVLFTIVLGFNASAVTFFVDPGNPLPVPPFTNWQTAATDIQSAIDAASDGDQILVTNGVYASGGRIVDGALTNRVVIDKAVTVQSVNGPTVTLIQGNRSSVVSTDVRCVYLTNGAVLAGFTITNGATLLSGDLILTECGGGIWCESTSVLVSNCIITGNRAQNLGGGAYSGTLENCVLQNNSAYGGGGAGSNILNSCLLLKNSAAAGGGGAYLCILNNCTIVTNSANAGCGTYHSTLNNCISYDNFGGAYANYYDCILNYCCTTPIPIAGIANFTNAPEFVDSSVGNYQLQSNSPCINAGNNSFVTDANDLSGNARIVGGTVDAGAYEFQTPASELSYAWIAWAQQFGLPTDGAAYGLDSDGDHLNNWQEWIADTNPTNAASCLRLLITPSSPSSTKVTWQSVNGKTYYLQRSINLAIQPAFFTIRSNIIGQTGTTSFFDNTATGIGPYFYRVGVQ